MGKIATLFSVLLACTNGFSVSAQANMLKDYSVSKCDCERPCRGPTGTTGVTGPRGPTGGQGPAGTKGNIGASGPSGPIGPTGNTGPNGNIGPRGPTGPSGTPIASAFASAYSNNIINIPVNATSTVIFTNDKFPPAGITHVLDTFTINAPAIYLINWSVTLGLNAVSVTGASGTIGIQVNGTTVDPSELLDTP